MATSPPAHNEGGSLLKNLALAVLERTISAMIPAEFGALKTRITAHLRKEGVACSETLASELDAPHGSVRIALEELSEEKVKEVRRLPFLARKITEEITEARRIFIIKPMVQASMQEDYPPKALRALEAYGGKPTLMFMTDGAAHPHVEWAATSLLHGHIVQFADQDHVLGTTRSADWLAVCRSAAHLIATA